MIALPILSLKDCVRIGRVEENCLIDNELKTKGYEIWKKLFQKLMNFDIKVNITGDPIKYELILKYNGQQYTAEVEEEYYAKPPINRIIEVYISSSDGKLLEDALRQVKEIGYKEDEINLIVRLFSRLKDIDDDENKIKEIITRYSSEYPDYDIWSDILKEFGEEDFIIEGVSKPVSSGNLELDLIGDKEIKSKYRMKKHLEEKTKATGIAIGIKKPKSEKLKARQEKSSEDRSKRSSRPTEILTIHIPEQTRGYDPNSLEEKSKVERAGMEVVMWWERHKKHRNPEDVSAYNLGYDIRSKDPRTGEYYYIEVKAFKSNVSRVILTENEYLAAQYYRDKYLLYILENAIKNLERIERGEKPDSPIIISDPAKCEFTPEKIEQYILDPTKLKRCLEKLNDL